jgi:O-antigen ligase
MSENAPTAGVPMRAVAHPRVALRIGSQRWAVALAAAAGAALVGWLLVVFPPPVLLLAAVGPVLLLASSPRLRVVFFVFGGIFVFQSSPELTPLKLAFLGGAAVSVVGALVHSRTLRRHPAYFDVAPLLRASVAFVALVLVSLPVALAYGSSPTAWLRDVAPYVLFAAAPLLALDAQSAWSAHALRLLLLIAGIIGCAAFTATWLSARGIASVPPIGLPTLLLGAALFAYAVALVLEGERGSLVWALIASLVIAGLVSTGTRSAAVLLIAPLAIVVGSKQGSGGRTFRLLVVVPAIALVVVLGVRSVVTATGANTDALASRIELLTQTGSAADGSFLERRLQTQGAWDMFVAAPVLGQGPGRPIAWTDAGGRVTEWQSVDSPLGYAAKFGVVGLLPLAVLAYGFVLTLQRIRCRARAITPAYLALVGYAAILVAWSALQVPFEDKGLASGFLLLLALALAEAGDRPTRERIDAREGVPS